MHLPRIPRPIVVSLLAILILACNATPVESPGPTAAATGSGPTPPPSAGGSPAGERPSVTFGWPDGETPAVTREMTGLDEAYINPGAVIDDDGELHMFANVFTAWPGEVLVSHLVSTDGAAWSLAAEEPVLTSEEVPYARPGADVSTGFVAADGTWVLVFETVNAASPWEIGLATAPGPDGPWTIEPEPVLTPGPAGAFDAGGLAWPSVVATDDGFAMYYSTYATDRRAGVIARATSTDGRAWTKDPEPVLVPEAAWQGRGLDRPRVVRTDDGYVMVYAGAVLTDRGVAFSDDGVSWTRDGDAPAITDDDFPVTGRAWDAALVNRDGELVYYLEIGVATQALGTEIYRATAPLP
jgi:predicted GH43/DUF377 family glycosyl hydrolase